MVISFVTMKQERKLNSINDLTTVHCAMNINEELDELFDSWEQSQHYDKFVRDGVFNNTPDACCKWKHASRRIAFLLKDNPDGKGDTRGWIDPNCGTEGNMKNNLELKNLFIKNLAYAFYAMSFDEFDFDKIRFEDVQAHALQSPWALVECKKQAGEKIIAPSVLAAHIKTDKQYLWEEFNILSPNIYICCTGTMEVVRDYFRNKYSTSLVTDIEGIDSKYNVAYHPETNTLILMCYHPSHPRCRRSPRNYVNDILKHYCQFLATPYGKEFLSRLG